MNKQFLSALLALFSGAVSTTALAQHIHVLQEADGVVVTIENPKKYLLIPIEEERGEVKMRLETGSPADTWMDVRRLLCAASPARGRKSRGAFL